MPMVSPTGLILAGGYGKRLKPLTDTLPKPLIELKEGYCILDKQLNDLRFAGSNEVVLMTGYLHDKIEKKYGNEWKGLRIRYSVEDKPLGTWGAIKKAIQELALKGPLAIMNGDIITTTIVSFREKPVLTYYINGGVYFVKEAEELLSAGADLSPPSSIENDVFPRLARAGKLGVYIEPDTDVLWKSLDSIKDLEEVRNIYQNRTDKPWGFELVVALTEKYLQKKLYIKEGYRTSMHYHEYKMETLYVVKGKVRVEFPDSKAIELNEGERHTIEPKTVHSIIALRNTYIDEASSPHPSDTIRVKDYYLR